MFKWRNNKDKKALRILLTTNAVMLLAGGMLGPIYALFVKEIGGDILDAGFAGAVFALAAGITVILSGKMSDAIRESELIVIAGYGLMGVGFLLFIWVDSIWSLLMVQVLIGIGEAIYAPAFDGLYTRHITIKTAGSQWGAWEAMSYLVSSAAAAIGGFIAFTYGFIPLFIIMAILALLNILYLLILPRKII